MKVAVDARMDAGGVGRYASDLRAGLQSDAHVALHVIDRAMVSEAPFTPWGRRAVARHVHANRVDVLHGLHFEVPRVTVPAVVTMPDAIPLEFPASMPSPIRRAYFSWMVHAAARRATKVITVSGSSAAALTRHGIPASKVEVVPLGVGERFRPGTEAEVNEARERFAATGPYVAVVADDKPHKNLDLLAEVAEKLSPAVRIVCRGAVGRPLGRVEILPRLTAEELRLFYLGAEAVLVPSIVEGFGLPALEAAACGVPVVCGRTIGAAEHLADVLVFVDVTDADEVAGRLRSTVDGGRASSRELVAAARHLSIGRMATGTGRIYDAVCVS